METHPKLDMFVESCIIAKVVVIKSLLKYIFVITKRVAQTQGLDQDPMGTPRLTHLRPDKYSDG